MTRFFLLLALFLPRFLAAQCLPPSNPSADYGSYNSGLSIETNFNNGRRWEETNLGLTPNCLGDLAVPAGGWGSMTPAQKSIYIIQAERAARTLLPLTGIEVSLSSVAQAHADWLRTNNHFSHTGNPAQGTSCSQSAGSACETAFTGSCLSQRINSNVNIANCWSFISENIGVATGSGADIAAITIFGMMYSDLACCSWGHRNNFLKVYTNNYGSPADEGFIGIGESEGAGYVWPYGPSPSCPTYFAKIIVYDFYDPQSGGGCAYVVLPIELVFFKIEEENCHPRLVWQTASESQNAAFFIEKSLDGQRWRPVGQLNGHGTTQETHDYDWLGEATDAAFYRLRQTDFDGKETLSKIEFFSPSCRKSAGWMAVQNPVNEAIELRLAGEFPEEITYRVARADGVLMKTGAAFDGQARIECADWPAGFYLVFAENRPDLPPLRIVKQ